MYNKLTPSTALMSTIISATTVLMIIGFHCCQTISGSEAVTEYSDNKFCAHILKEFDRNNSRNDMKTSNKTSQPMTRHNSTSANDIYRQYSQCLKSRFAKQTHNSRPKKYSSVDGLDDGMRFKRERRSVLDGEGMRFKKDPILDEEGMRFKKDSLLDEEGMRFKKSVLDGEGMRFKKAADRILDEEGMRFKKSVLDGEGMRFKKQPSVLEDEGMRFKKASVLDGEGMRFRKGDPLLDEEGMRFKKQSVLDDEGMRFKKASVLDGEGMRFRKSVLDGEGMRFKKLMASQLARLRKLKYERSAPDYRMNDEGMDGGSSSDILEGFIRYVIMT